RRRVRRAGPGGCARRAPGGALTVADARRPDGAPGSTRRAGRDDGEGTEVHAPRTDPDELLTGRELRRLTARAAAARADAGPGEIVVDVAYAVVSVALATVWVVGIATMLRSSLDAGAATGPGQGLGPEIGRGSGRR